MLEYQILTKTFLIFGICVKFYCSMGHTFVFTEYFTVKEVLNVVNARPAITSIAIDILAILCC